VSNAESSRFLVLSLASCTVVYAVFQQFLISLLVLFFLRLNVDFAILPEEKNREKLPFQAMPRAL